MTVGNNRAHNDDEESLTVLPDFAHLQASDGSNALLVNQPSTSELMS